MIKEVKYDNPERVGYLSAIRDNGDCIGFRKLDGEFLPLIGDVTQVDIADSVKNALHELETTQGLYAHDGNPDETFQLSYEGLPALRHIAVQLVEEK